MARDNVAITAVTLNAGTAQPAGTTINVTNGAEVASNDTDNLMLEIRNTDGTDRVATIVAGVGPLAEYGDLAITVPATSGVMMVALEGARFVQADGKIYVNFAASFAGTIAAYRLPQGL